MPRASLWVLGAVALVLAATSSLAIGAVGTGPGEVARALLEALGLAPSGTSLPEHVSVVANIRAPRIVTAIAVGASLGAAGATMQGVFRNPLADPSLLGVSLGAALGAACVLVLVDHIGSTWWTPAGAFVGGVIATTLAMASARRRGTLDTAALLLGGIAVQAFCGAMIGLLTYIASDAKQRDLTFWLLGSLGGATWGRLAASAAPLLASIAVLPWLGGSLDVLSLGQAEASDLGVDVRRTRLFAVLLSALGVGAAVAVTGPIGFVGLVVPHLCRYLGAVSYRTLIPASALGGAVLLVIADTAARTMAQPAELPIGVVTAFIGAPFFYILLMRRPSAESS